MNSPHKQLFQSFKLGHLTLKNRIVSTSHSPAYADAGMPGERYQLYHEEKAKGGLSLTMFGGSSSVSDDSPASFGQLNAGSDQIVAHLRKFSARIHQHDVALMCQLSHAGRRTRPTGGNWLPTVAPSALREPAHGAMPKVIEIDDIKRIANDYALAAKRCFDGEIDGIELLASGHLIGQFWSPLSNHRRDAYGGSFENRMRFGLEVLERIRELVPGQFVISLRFTANEFIEGGIDEEEGIAIARHYATSGLVDCLNVSGGANWTKAGVAETVPSMAYASGRFVELAGKVRKATGLPVMHAAGVADFATANRAVADGHVDLIGMTRAQIADPHLVRKHLAGQDDAIRPCVGAGHCIDRIYMGGDSLCLHNTVTGREQILSHTLQPTSDRQSVVLIGAGPAGLEAARVLAERGHKVHVLEAHKEPGGQVRYIAGIDWRRGMLGITRWLYERCVALGVTFEFNRYMQTQDVIELQADVVILATGGAPQMDTIEGAAQFANTSWDLLNGDMPIGQRVLVYDETGSQSGPGCAEKAGSVGALTQLVTPDRMIAQDVGVTNHAIHLRNLHHCGVEIKMDQRLSKIERNGNQLTAYFQHEYSGVESTQVYDQIVVEAGTVPDDALYSALIPHSANQGLIDQQILLAGGKMPAPLPLAESSFALYRIGDCVSARGIHAALLDAQRLCRCIG